MVIFSKQSNIFHEKTYCLSLPISENAKIGPYTDVICIVLIVAILFLVIRLSIVFPFIIFVIILVIVLLIVFVNH